METCPVCNSAVPDTDIQRDRGLPSVTVACPRCGSFALVGTAIAVLAREGDGARHRRAITSHAIRRMQRGSGGAPAIFEDQLRAIWLEDRLPGLEQQSALFILLVGRLQPSWSEPVLIGSQQIDGEIGAALTPAGQPSGSEWIADYLRSQLLVNCDPPVVGKVRVSLTYFGWQRHDELQRQSSDSRTAFMAMKFGRPRSDAMFRDQFIQAVRATGFELQRLDTRPKAGLIDARMEVEIRTARFLIADLTHGNRGAYWEAGFAAGLGKPVFYTCEEGYFRRYSTHFDTNHHYIVMWNAAQPEVAVEDLKAAIRATLPGEAKMRDD
jgi:hypothetical protein